MTMSSSLAPESGGADAPSAEDRVPLILATGADALLAERVAAELGLFDAVYASDGVTNLTGETKAARLVSTFGRGGFDYAGNSAQDRTVFAAARKVVLVGEVAKPEMAAAEWTVHRRFPQPASQALALWESLRAYQWCKNALVFLPLLLAHRLFELRPLLAGRAALPRVPDDRDFFYLTKGEPRR